MILRQCIDCVQESRPYSQHYTGRSFWRTWHLKGHKKHVVRDGHTFFDEETFFKSVVQYFKKIRKENKLIRKAMNL